MAEKEPVFTRRVLTIGAAGAFAPAVIVAVAVGWFAGWGKRHGFEWEPAAVAGTGIATAFLALFTGALAFSTAHDVSATRQLAKTDRERFAKEDEPWIAVDVVTTKPIVATLTSQTSIVNTGRGPAIGVFWEVYFLDESAAKALVVEHPPLPPGTTNEWRGIAGILLSGGRSEVSFPNWIKGGTAGRYRLRGWYTDRDRELFIVYGDEPDVGWLAWLQACQADDDFWNLRGRDIRRELIRHR